MQRILIITQSIFGERNHVRMGRLPRLLNNLGYQSVFVCPRKGDDLPPDPTQFQAVYIDGGMFSANSTDEIPWLMDILTYVEKCLRDSVPLLGVCLGASLIARALGAKVSGHASGHGELGYRLVKPTLGGNELIPKDMYAYMWHQEGAETPPGAELLGSSKLFNQAFKFGENVVGLQFHPEATTKIVRRWLMVADRSKITFAGADSPTKQLVDSITYDADIELWFQGFLNLWLAGAEKKAK